VVSRALDKRRLGALVRAERVLHCVGAARRRDKVCGKPQHRNMALNRSRVLLAAVHPALK